MIITGTVTKKVIESIVHETFSKFGHISASFLLDSLKLLGFYYATNAGISINVEDLKTPKAKSEYLKVAFNETKEISELWVKGLVSDEERFQCIIDSWNFATEILKNQIIEYYQKFDPANNLYIMAFSGARGNISQVRQLVGMRGLMSDQEGRIIDLPIKANFREGLSSIDYMISSYGARKGIVDTALKTADSGYLTRRLIYVAQDLVIREINCNSQNGLILLLNRDIKAHKLLGRFSIVADTFSTNGISNGFVSKMITKESFKKLKEKRTQILKLRSPLTCQANGSICQYCYGWDLAQSKIIALGEAVGVIAAQSIGEPGTQLTMRTFHTGGIFTSERVKQTFLPFSGKFRILSEFKSIPYRTQYGTDVVKLEQEATLLVTSWEGLQKKIIMKKGAFFHLKESEFVKKGTLAFESPTKSLIAGEKRMKPIYSKSSGEILFEKLSVKQLNRKGKSNIKINDQNGILWLAKGNILTLPKEARCLFVKNTTKKRAIGSLKIITPYAGLISYKNNNLFIVGTTCNISLDFSNILNDFKDYRINFLKIIKNYQHVDAFTTVGYINVYPKKSEKIYSVRTKKGFFNVTYLLIGESNSWKIVLDQQNILQNRKQHRVGNPLNDIAFSNNSGFLIKQDGLTLIYQQAIPVLISHGTILKYKQGDFLKRNELIGMLVNFTQQNEDIVQGLPKIEEIIEARAPKLKAELAKRPGILLKERGGAFEKFDLSSKNLFLNYISNTNKKFGQEETNVRTFDSLKTKKFPMYVLHNFGFLKNLAFFNQKIWKVSSLPVDFFPFRLKGKNDFCFINLKGRLLKINIGSKKLSVGWSPSRLESASNILFREKNETWKALFLEKKAIQFQNKKSNDFILKLAASPYLYFEEVNTLLKYSTHIMTPPLQKFGSFIDIGEPLTEGMLNPHNLLLVLFKYHLSFDGIFKGTIRSLNKFQLILVNSIQAIYQSQGVTVSSKHVEIIIRQMTAKSSIKEPGDTPLLPGELVQTSLILEIIKSLTKSSQPKKFKLPKYEPLLLSATNSSLNKDGFLSAAGFQETKRVLTRASIYGSFDWLRGLKECVLLGRLVPAGSAFLNYKNYLDNIYLFKD